MQITSYHSVLKVIHADHFIPQCTESDPCCLACKTWPAIQLCNYTGPTIIAGKKIEARYTRNDQYKKNYLQCIHAYDWQILNTSLQKYLQSKLLEFNTIDN